MATKKQEPTPSKVEECTTSDTVNSPLTPKQKDTNASAAMEKIGKSLLNANPAISVVYVTADGCGFFENNDAKNHASTLNNKSVATVNK